MHEASGAGRDRVVWADDDAATVQGALDDLVAPSLFGGPGVLVVRRAEGLTGSLDDALLALLPQTGDRARLILVARALDQRRRVHAACVKAGGALGFPRLGDARAAGAWVGRLARDRGRTIAPAAIEALVERVGVDLARLDDEVEKLALQVGAGQAIEPRHVHELVAATRTQAIAELADRLAQRDAAGAVRALRGLLAAGEPALRIVAFLAANLRQALHVTELRAAGLRDEEVAARLGMSPWLVGRRTGRGSPADLARALAALAELDLALKSSRPEAASFERMLLAVGAPAAVRATGARATAAPRA
jgi:DNA polymerase III subunit delta